MGTSAVSVIGMGLYTSCWGLLQGGCQVVCSKYVIFEGYLGGRGHASCFLLCVLSARFSGRRRQMSTLCDGEACAL